MRADFRDAKNVLDALGLAAVDGALVDLGVSSPQLDEAERGFSFSRPGPLDMRMSDEGEPLLDLLRRIDERELARILREYGEERFARPIARAMKRAVEGGRSTRHRGARGRRGRRDPAPAPGRRRSTPPPGPSRRSGSP